MKKVRMILLAGLMMAGLGASAYAMTCADVNGGKSVICVDNGIVYGCGTSGGLWVCQEIS